MLEKITLHIEQIRPELTWRMRRDVLYPTQPLFEMEMDEDNNGWHFGAFYNDALIGVVSLFEQNNNFQLRKFAIKNGFRHQGTGSALLQHIIGFTVNAGASRLWCNARISAIGFYSKAGFKLTTHTFSKNGFDYQTMEKQLIKKPACIAQPGF